MAIGLHASVAIPAASFAARVSRCWRYGCSSTWLTVGTTSAVSSSRARWSGWKLDTPIARTRPSRYSFSIARQVSAAVPASGRGQWMRYRSSTSKPSRSMVASKARSVES